MAALTGLVAQEGLAVRATAAAMAGSLQQEQLMPEVARVGIQAPGAQEVATTTQVQQAVAAAPGAAVAVRVVVGMAVASDYLVKVATGQVEHQTVLVRATPAPPEVGVAARSMGAAAEIPQPRRLAVARSASSGPAIFANFPQQEQQTNKDHSWNTHS